MLYTITLLLLILFAYTESAVTSLYDDKQKLDLIFCNIEEMMRAKSLSCPVLRYTTDVSDKVQTAPAAALGPPAKQPFHSMLLAM